MLSNIYDRLFKPAGIVNFTDGKAYRRACVYIINVVALALIACTVAISAYTGDGAAIAPFILPVISLLVSLVWVHKQPHKGRRIITFLALAMSIWGVASVLLVTSGSGSRLLWMALLPFIVCCAGLRRGCLFFGIFFTILFLLFFTPLENLCAHSFSTPFKARFLVVLAGAFAFASSVEYLRSKTNRALLTTVLRLERDALTDPLTGLGNRRDFQTYFTSVSGKSARDNLPFSIIMVDIDLFKRVNDTHGHDVGDKVLQHITATLTNALRSMDRVFRWGGEEFVLLLPDTGLSEARIAAERIRRSVEETPCVIGDLEIHYTISIGIYSGDAKGAGGKMHEQINIADQNLYLAKDKGGNTVVG